MKVHELIALLKTVDQDKDVFVWVDGDRYEVAEVDPVGDWYVDINVFDHAPDSDETPDGSWLDVPLKGFGNIQGETK